MPDKFAYKKLVLASGSPRRAEILRAVGWPFETVVANIDETLQEGETPVAYVRRLALAKADKVAAHIPRGRLVLGADTTVVVADEICGQPRDDDDARRMLKLLRGCWHEVLTGVALVHAGSDSRRLVDHEVTRVRFAEMTDEEIDWYVATGDPKGKAGAYAIQGAAAIFIEAVEGDYFNIVGLPVRLVYEMSQRI